MAPGCSPLVHSQPKNFPYNCAYYIRSSPVSSAVLAMGGRNEAQPPSDSNSRRSNHDRHVQLARNQVRSKNRVSRADLERRAGNSCESLQETVEPVLQKGSMSQLRGLWIDSETASTLRVCAIYDVDGKATPSVPNLIRTRRLHRQSLRGVKTRIAA